MLAVLLALAVPCLAMAADFAVVSGGKLNLRAYASATSQSLGRYNAGAWVQVTGGSIGGWYPVRTMDGKRGYMAGGYLTFSGSGGSAYVSTRNGGKVNVRSGPSFSFGTVGSLATGTRVSVLLKGTGWYWISGGGISGFMSTTYLSDSGYRPVPGPTAAPYWPSGGQTAWVNNPRSTQVLNLRESPSQASRSIGQYYNNTEVRVVNYGPTWCEVYVGGVHGYMMTRYLRFGGFAPTHAPYYPKPTAEPYYPYYPIPVTPVPTATPTPLVEYLTPKPAGPAAPTAGQDITLAPAAGGGSAINVYNDAKLTVLKATYGNGKAAKMLQYGENVCMILIDGGVGYVSTWNVNY